MGGAGIGMEEHLQRELNVFSGQRLTVVEAHVIAQVKGIGESVCGDFPACGQVRMDGDGIGVAVDQLAEEIVITGGEDEPVAARHGAGTAGHHHFATVLGR